MKSVKMQPSKLTHYMFQPTERAILRCDITEMYTQEGTTEKKEVYFLQVWNTISTLEVI
jgi:hypothetical protein